MGETRDLFKKIRDTKGKFHAKMGSIKDRNGIDLTEAEDIKKRWQEHTEELYKKDLHDPDNHDGVITHLSSSSVQSLSCVQLFATPWTVAYQASPSLRFSRQEYWSVLPLFLCEIIFLLQNLEFNKYFRLLKEFKALIKLSAYL